jgi:hypothetical protein
MISGELIQATSPVDSQIVEAVGQAAQRAYTVIGGKNAARIHAQQECKKITPYMVRELMGFYPAGSQLAERQNLYSKPSYGGNGTYVDVEQHEYGTIDLKHSEIIFDGTWQQFLPRPSLLKSLKRRFSNDAEPEIVIPKVLIGSRESVSRAAQQYGVRSAQAEFWQKDPGQSLALTHR